MVNGNDYNKKIRRAEKYANMYSWGRKDVADAIYDLIDIINFLERKQVKLMRIIIRISNTNKHLRKSVSQLFERLTDEQKDELYKELTAEWRNEE